MSSDTLQIIIHKEQLLTIIAFISYYFTLLLHLYDMIKNDNLRMICRSMSESYLISFAWLIHIIIGFYTVKEKTGTRFYILLCISAIGMTIFANLDYRNRIKPMKNQKMYKTLHYIFAYYILLCVVYYQNIIKNGWFYPLLFLILLFGYIQVFYNPKKSKFKIKHIKEINICLELFILFFGTYLGLIANKLFKHKFVNFVNE